MQSTAIAFLLPRELCKISRITWAYCVRKLGGLGRGHVRLASIDIAGVNATIPRMAVLEALRQTTVPVQRSNT
jgi:hypothetical protein